MMSIPKLLETVRKYRYGRSESLYEEGKCAKEVWKGIWISYQCARKNGYGPHGLYCKQHAKMFEVAQVVKETGK